MKGNQDNNNPNGAKKRRFDDAGGGPGTGGTGSVREADCAEELRVHGYEVKPQAEDIVDSKYVSKQLVNVWQLLDTYTPR